MRHVFLRVLLALLLGPVHQTLSVHKHANNECRQVWQGTKEVYFCNISNRDQFFPAGFHVLDEIGHASSVLFRGGSFGASLSLRSYFPAAVHIFSPGLHPIPSLIYYQKILFAGDGRLRSGAKAHTTEVIKHEKVSSHLAFLQWISYIRRGRPTTKEEVIQIWGYILGRRRGGSMFDMPNER